MLDDGPLARTCQNGDLSSLGEPTCGEAKGDALGPAMGEVMDRDQDMTRGHPSEDLRDQPDVFSKAAVSMSSTSSDTIGMP